MHFSAVKDITEQQIKNSENPWRVKQFEVRLKTLVERLESMEQDLHAATKNAKNLTKLLDAILERMDKAT